MQYLPERRSAPRVAARPNTARIGWRKGGAAGELAARIVDVSHTGALVEAPGWPEGREPAWLRLDGPVRTGRARVAVTRRAAAGCLAVAFDGACPTELLWAATLGLSFGHMFGCDAGDGRSGDDWTFGA